MAPKKTVKTYAERLAAHKKELKRETSAIQSNIDQDVKLKASEDTAISSLKKQLAAATDPTVIANLKTQIATHKTASDGYQLKIGVLNGLIQKINATNTAMPNWQAVYTRQTGTSVSDNTPVPVVTDGAVSYNVSSVSAAYFNDRAAFMKEISPSIQNTPKYITDAANLWVGGVANKGMIQTWNPPSSYTDTSAFGNKAPAGKVNTLKKRHGFQFQYNPTMVDMSYTGMALVDPMFEASGQDMFNYLPGQNVQSTIAFQVLINRVYDMKYYGTDGKLLKMDKNPYPASRQPSVEDQQAIYHRGTMYDLEYLFRTLLGYTMESQLRGGHTADMGFIGAMPVELHLGEGLRYLVTVASINVSHVLFNERMVPLFSKVDITCNRLPDYTSLRVQSTDKSTKKTVNNQFYDPLVSNGRLPGSTPSNTGNMDMGTSGR
jgi:hypothetical protein